MHARDLVELASLLSMHGPLVLKTRQPIPKGGIEEYWVASKSRLDRWGRTLRELADRPVADPTPGQRQRPLLRSVCEEILTGEILTRVWAAVLCAWDRSLGTDQAEPIARSVLLGHLEARHRVLTLLVSSPAIDTEEAVRLNRLRRRTERWSDLLLARLMGTHDVLEFAIEPGRVRDFAQDLLYQGRRRGGRHVWPLVMAALRASFRQGLTPVSPNADLNERIAASILASFPTELFDATGLFYSAWLVRLSKITGETEVMLDDLLAVDEPRPAIDPQAPVIRRFSGRSRRFRPE